MDVKTKTNFYIFLISFGSEWSTDVLYFSL